MNTVSFPRLKRPRLGVYYPPPSSGEVKQNVELYYCYLSVSLCLQGSYMVKFIFVTERIILT